MGVEQKLCPAYSNVYGNSMILDGITLHNLSSKLTDFSVCNVDETCKHSNFIDIVLTDWEKELNMLRANRDGLI